MTNPQINVFFNITEAYFSMRLEQGVERKEAIIEACLATGREYNPSMYSRWTKSPQQDVLRYMQIVTGPQMLVKAGLTQEQAEIVTGNLAVPVDDTVLARISAFINDPKRDEKIAYKSSVTKEVSRLSMNVSRKLNATSLDELKDLAKGLDKKVPVAQLRLLEGFINAPKGKKGDTNIYRIEDHASLEEIAALADLVADLASVESKEAA